MLGFKVYVLECLGFRVYVLEGLGFRVYVLDLSLLLKHDEFFVFV